MAHKSIAENAAVLAEADLRAQVDAGAGAADVVLFFARDAHHHGTAGLLRQNRRNRHRLRARNLAAESAAGVLADDDDLILRDVDPLRDVGDRPRDRLRRAVQIQLAVLPVRHRRARLHRLMAGGLVHERLVENVVGVLEARVDVADLPPDRRVLEQRHAARVELGDLAAEIFISCTCGGRQTLPSARGFGPPGRSVTIGSTTNGSGSYSTLIFSIASAAVTSSIAATATIGSP